MDLQSALCWLICAKVEVTHFNINKTNEKVEIKTEQVTNVVRNDTKPQLRNSVSPNMDINARTVTNKQTPQGPQSIRDAIAKTFGEETPQVMEIVRRESNFHPLSINSFSGSCGLFQAFPCSKMGCLLSDVDCQVAWGRKYIKERYKTASAALAWHDSHGWY